jgi:hypothetical protein
MKTFFAGLLVLFFAISANAQILFEGFESTTFPPPGWTVHKPDNGSGWTRLTAGTSPIPGTTVGKVITAPDNGGIGIAYCHFTTGGSAKNDQWLVTPQFTPAFLSHFSFWIRKFDNYKDTIEVKLSTSGNSIADFTVDLDVFYYAAADTGFEFKSYDLTPWQGQEIYVAIREKTADNFTAGAAIFVDNVSVDFQGGLQNNEDKIYVSIFPNPATDYAMISSSEKIIRINVFDVLGKKVLSQIANSREVKVDTRHLLSGVYFINIETFNSTTTRKLYLNK